MKQKGKLTAQTPDNSRDYIRHSKNCTGHPARYPGPAGFQQETPDQSHEKDIQHPANEKIHPIYHANDFTVYDSVSICAYIGTRF